jgi:hypothetical protein
MFIAHLAERKNWNNAVVRARLRWPDARETPG